jgi:uncharacterized membrane protein
MTTERITLEEINRKKITLGCWACMLAGAAIGTIFHRTIIGLGLGAIASLICARVLIELGFDDV